MSNYKNEYSSVNTFRMHNDEVYLEFKLSNGMTIEQFAEWLMEQKKENKDVVVTVTIPTDEVIDFIKESIIETIIADSEKYPDAMDALKTAMGK